MKIVQINGGVFGSTGKIMFGIAKEAEKQGHVVLCASPITTTNRYEEPNEEYKKIGSFYGRCMSVLLARITGYEGCFSLFSTCKLLRKLHNFSPDIIHLHSIHNSYINVPLLFRYVKKNNIRLIWTLHDCWAFTGHCTHFEISGCTKWKTECKECKFYSKYPKTYLDNSNKMFRIKKKVFNDIKNLTIITPSKWLARNVERSFMKNNAIIVINNGIDLSVFRPRESGIKDRLGCKDKCVLLGVAFGWDDSKGLDVFIELSKRLDSSYQIVLVGTDEVIDSKLPTNIIGIRRTQDQHELAELYSAADLFINPTREDTFPTVNMEALACGTPVITFNTGGSAEIIDDNCGIVIEKDNLSQLEKVIRENKFWKKEVSDACVEHAKQYDMYQKFKEVVDIY